MANCKIVANDSRKDNGENTTTTTQAQRDEEKLTKIREIPIALIDAFPDHPFRVRDDEDMMQLVDSIKAVQVAMRATKVAIKLAVAAIKTNATDPKALVAFIAAGGW